MANLQLDAIYLGNLNDEEVLLLHDFDGPQNHHTRLPYWKYNRFDLEEMRDDECLVEFRFTKFQAVAAPNGLIANLFGPVEGRRHDSALLAMSGLLNQLEERSFSPNGNALCLYGDPAYPHRVHLRGGLQPVNEQNEGVS